MTFDLTSTPTFSETPLVVPNVGAPAPRAVQRVRVLHVVNGDQFAGAERVQDLLALRLGEFGYDVGFATLKTGKFAVERRSQAAPLIELAMRSQFDLRPVVRLAEWIRAEKYDLVHTHSPRSLMVGRLASMRCGVPHVHHVHSPTARDTTARWSSRRNALVERVFLTGVDRIVAVSASLGRYLQSRGIDDRRLRVVPNGVPIVGPLPECSAPGPAWTVGVVALFRPRKGLEVLLDALAALRTAGHDVRLRAIGGFETPEYEAAIRQRVARLGIGAAIDWTGFVRDVNAELRRVDLMALPSLFGEGLPMVVLEAMAAGVPVVATQVEGLPEAIHHGVDGLLVPAGQAAPLAEAIARFVRGDVSWSDLRQSAHERQANQFSDRSMTQSVARVYDELLTSTTAIPTNSTD